MWAGEEYFWNEGASLGRCAKVCHDVGHVAMQAEHCHRAATLVETTPGAQEVVEGADKGLKAALTSDVITKREVLLKHEQIKQKLKDLDKLMNEG